eukprot:1041264-Pyramimonas_sp.AAC.1
MADVRREECPAFLQDAARRVRDKCGETAAELFCRCLFPSPARCFPEPIPNPEHLRRWFGVPVGWRSPGPVFVDGSACHASLA